MPVGFAVGGHAFAASGGMSRGKLSAGHRPDNRQLSGQRDGGADFRKLARMPAARTTQHLQAFVRSGQIRSAANGKTNGYHGS